MKNNEYANKESTRIRDYAQAYDSPEFKAWVASLTPEQYRHAEAEGLLSPHFDSIVGCTPLEEQTTPNQDVFERNLEMLTEVIYSDPRHQRAMQTFIGYGKQGKINWSVLRYLCGEGSYSTHGQHIGLSKQSFHYHANQLKEKIFRNFGIKLERSD